MINAINAGIYNALKLWPETWTADTAYALGDIVKPTSYANHTYKCTTAGTSDSTTEPVWGTTNGGTTADNDVIWTTCDAKCYNTMAPQIDNMPCVIFGVDALTPLGTFADPAAIESIILQVSCFSGISPADVAEIADEVSDAMDTALSITGYTVMRCSRDYIGTVIWDSVTKTYQIKLRFKLLLDKT